MLKSGLRIYKYELVKLLGKGSFGEVWLAIDTTISNEVALKILPSTFSEVAVLLDEALIGHKFNHSNLLQIQYADVVNIDANSAITLIAQDYKPRGTVESMVNAQNFLTTPLLIKVLKDILLGLEYLHNGNIIHNDIKPGNILIDMNGNALLSDYGISGIMRNGTNLRPKNMYLLHSAPEIVVQNYKINILTDIFQVGCTAFRLANGISELKNEFLSNSDNYMQLLLSGKISNKKHQSHVPKRLASIIKKSMAFEPLHRFQSALEMRRELEKLSFAGYWTTDPDDSTKLIGIGNNNTYRFNIIAKPNSLFDFEAVKTSNSSLRTTKIAAFSMKSLGCKDLRKHTDNYLQWVINSAK